MKMKSYLALKPSTKIRIVSMDILSKGNAFIRKYIETQNDDAYCGIWNQYCVCEVILNMSIGIRYERKVNRLYFLCLIS